MYYTFEYMVKKTKHSRELSKLKTQFLDYYRELPIQKLAARFIGVHENTITNWKKKDKKFCDQVGSAESQWALDTSRKVKSAEWLLERIMKDHFVEKKDLEIGSSEKLESALDRLAKIFP